MGVAGVRVCHNKIVHYVHKSQVLAKCKNLCTTIIVKSKGEGDDNIKIQSGAENYN